MATRSFVHLHNHSQFSLLDGASRLEEMVERAAQFEMPAVAITDHGNLFGAIPFFEAAAEKGIKPILGCETYLAPGSRTDRTHSGGRKPYFHLLLLARDQEGYRNLMRLSTAGYALLTRLLRDVADRHCAGRMVAVTEGGYDLVALEACLEATAGVLNGSSEADRQPLALPDPTHRSRNAIAASRAAQQRYWTL